MKPHLRSLSLLCLLLVLCPAIQARPAHRAQDGYDEALGLLGEGIIDEAIGVLEMHLEERPADARGWALLASSMERLWREAGGSYLALNDARDAWRRAIELSPFDADILHGAAALDLTLGEYASAAALGMRALGTARLCADETPAGLVELVARARIFALRTAEHAGDEAWAADLDETWRILRGSRSEEPENAQLVLLEAELLASAGLPELAIESVYSALSRSPEDVSLNQRLIDLHTGNGITARLPARYVELARAGMTGIGAWYTGYVDRLVADDWLRERNDPRALELYERCMSWMDAATLLEPSFESGARAIRIQARVSRAWCLIGTEEFDRAEMELLDMLTHLTEWRETPDGLGRTMMGALSTLGDRFAARNRYGRAAGVARAVVAVLPDEGQWWNNLGFLLREYGTQVESGVMPGVEEQAAPAIFRESWEAYERAVEILPEDARVVNDAALIQVYHLQDRLEYAEELLRRSIRLGEAQLEELGEAPAPSERFPIAEAVGDAYQNLGYLYYHVLDRPAESREYWVASMATDSGDRSTFQTYVDAIDGLREEVDEGGQGGGRVPGPLDQAAVRARVAWQASLEDARALAGDERPLLIYYRGKALGLSITLLDFLVGRPQFQENARGAVLLMADGLRHNFVDRTKSGRRLACSKWGSVTCAEHLAVAEALGQWWLEEHGSEAGEAQEGMWTTTPGESGYSMFESPFRLLGEEPLWPVETVEGSSVDDLVARARSGDPEPLVRDRRLAARLRLEELLFDESELRRTLVRALRDEAGPASLELLDAAIRQQADAARAREALVDWNQGDLTAVEQAARWSPDERVREAATQVLSRELEGFARRALARERVTQP